MAGVKANWHLDDLDATGVTEDPMQVGVQVDIGGRSEADLYTELSDLLMKEAGYAKYSNVECQRKHDPRHILMGGDQLSCYTCPHYAPYGQCSDGHSVVCKVGREQEDLVVMLQALKRAEAGSLDQELVAHFEAQLEAAAELAEAALC